MRSPDLHEVAIGVVGVAVAAFVMRFIQVRRFYRDLPKPPHSFLWGHLRLFAEIQALFPPDTSFEYVFCELAKRYDLPDIWYIDLWPLGTPMMIVAGIAAADVMVSPSYPMHSFNGAFIAPLLGDNIIVSANGPMWKSLHHMIAPSFTPLAVKQMVPRIVHHAVVFRERLARLASRGKTFELEPEISKLVFDVTSDFVLGFSFNAQGPRGSDVLEDLRTVLNWGMLRLLSWNPLRHLAAWWVIRWAKRRTDRWIEKALRNRYRMAKSEDPAKLPSAKTAKSVLDRVILQRIEAMGAQAELGQDFVRLMVANLAGLLAGGHGTTTDTLCYAYLLMSLHTEVLQKVREEHERVFGSSPDDVVEVLKTAPSKTQEMEYTTAVLKETLRLFPVGFKMRKAPEGVSALVSAGKSYPLASQMIVTSSQLGHFNHALFAEPTRFLPERFLDGYEPKPHRMAWRPFGKGPRVCIGQETAVEEMRVILALTVRWFDFELVQADPPPRVSKVTFTDWETKIGEQAFQKVGISAGPRGGLPMQVKFSGWRA